jgi:hypothetical protein
MSLIRNRFENRPAKAQCTSIFASLPALKPETARFPFIAPAVGKLPVRSCLIDGESIICDEHGFAVFDLIRRYGALDSAYD